MTVPRRRRTRGYPLAGLVGLEGSQAHIWDLYSESVKLNREVQGAPGYGLYESIVEALRPAIVRGVRSILIATPDNKEYGSFIDHLRRRHSWLFRSGSQGRTVFAQLSRPATSPEQVRSLVKSEEFKEKLAAVLGEDLLHILNLLDQRLSDSQGVETMLFSLKEVEAAVYRDGKSVEYILVTERFRDQNRGRIERLLQMASNKKMKTRIILRDTSAEARVSQFGGLLCLLRE